MEYHPYPYQRAAERWIYDHPAAGLFLDMGLGKTVITLTAIQNLIYDRLEVARALVIAPKRVAEDTWTREHRKWDHLTPLTISPILGAPSERRAALAKEADLYIIGRDNVKWLVETLGKDWPFDMIVIDELSSFKNPSSVRFKALRRVRPAATRVVGLTGTPSPNSLIDLWSQIYLLDMGERLEKTLTRFRNKYCNAVFKQTFTEYTITPDGGQAIMAAIDDICISMKARDYLDLPPVTFIDRHVRLGKKERAAYEEMAETFVLELGHQEVTAVNAAVLTGKLLQIANGAIYGENGKAQHLHDAKITALAELIEEARGEPVLVFYSFKSDLERIMAAFPEAVKLEGQEDIAAWNNGEIPILLTHPASAGHGLNLQDGGAVTIWFGLPWSLELYQQANARLHRQGQKKPVRIYHLIAEGTMDERVLAALQSKDETQEALMAAVRATVAEVRGRSTG